MKRIDLKTAADWSGGEVVCGDPGTMIGAVTTDTRTLRDGELFVALSGESFDAHHFLATARDQGAAAAVVSRIPEGFGADAASEFPLILVGDTLVALQSMAASYRRELDPLVVAVTGSNGKTSTKDFLSAVLGTKYRVHATPGNLNNHIGLPLTLLSAPEDTECVVCELGMSNPGEIAPLASIAKPDIAVITNIGTAHIEFMGSRDAIAMEKGALAEAVGSEGWVILNAEDDYTDAIAARIAAQVVRAGVESGEIRAEELRSEGAGICFSLNATEHNALVELSIPGRHMAGNAVLAAAAGLVAGVELDAAAEALTGASLTGGRLQRVQVSGLDILDDTYNANPDSVRAALSTLKGLPCTGRRIAVLGRMAELGSEAEAAHSEVGAFAVQQGIDEVISVGGEDAAAISEGASESEMNGVANHFDTPRDCADYLIENAGSNDLILIKGSRSSQMEKVIHLLSKES